MSDQVISPAADQLHQLYQELEAQVAELPLAFRPADIVPGEGDPEADILFIGEAPGLHESQQRRPFVGRSGQLFRQTLEAVGINVPSIFISNIVKVRPPDNRDPLPKEILAYKPFLDREIEIINPSLIVTLGRLSMGKFLPDVKISMVHGRLHRVKWHNQLKYVLPMYHPAAALRSTKMKESFIEDFQKIPRVIEWIHQQKESDQLLDTVKDSLW